MKKIFFAILSCCLLLTACQKGTLKPMPQNPYRTIIEYTPTELEMDVVGALTPVEEYNWIHLDQKGNKVTFTIRRNTSGKIRRAEFKMAGSSNLVVVNQKAHGLDANVEAELVSQAAGMAEIECAATSQFTDDYASWGIAYSKTTDVASAQHVSQHGNPVVEGRLTGALTGLEDGVDYYVWTYVESTEGDKAYSPMIALLPPVFVREGEDLQAAIDAAKPYSRIMVQGGCTFVSPKNGFLLGDGNVNKTVTGGWNADFTKQSMNNLTVIDGNKKNYGFWCANSDGSEMKGYANVSYFEIINCAGEHGTAVHVVGGPVTVTNCYVHNNDSVKGAIGTNEETYSSDLTVANCILVGNEGAGHGPALGFGDGKSDAEPVKATVVNCLIMDNVSTKKDGYCSTFICYNHTILVFVNNTVVGNKNWAEYGGPWSGMQLRGNVASLFANNIMVGNYISPCTKEMEQPDYQRHETFLHMGGSAGTLANNIIEGTIKDGANIVSIDNISVGTDFDVASILDENAKPKGIVLGAGTLKTHQVSSKVNGFGAECNIKALLEKYKTDLAGNPRITNGKVDLGCFQAQ